MKISYTFKTYEVTIDYEKADDLREKIKEVACQYGITVEPAIQYVLLRNSIISTMSNHLSERFEFVYEGKKADFEQNDVMFSVSILKRLFSKDKKDHNTFQLKNLDILSFYAYGCSWYEKYPQSNGFDDSLSDMVNINPIIDSNQAIIENEQNNENIIITNEKLSTKTYNKYLFGILCLVFASLIYVFWLYFSIDEEYKTFERKYQTNMQRFFAEYNSLKGFNPLYYDTLQVVDTTRAIFHKNFNIDTHLYFRDAFKISIIKSDDNFQSEPGFKKCDILGGIAFGFGTTYCQSDCNKIYETKYLNQNNTTILRITLPDYKFITYLTFKWVEIGSNWGSGGYVYLNKDSIKTGNEPYHYIGIFPPSNLLKDETVRNYRIKLDKRAKDIDIVISDIADGSEIFINDIIVYGW